MREDLIYNIHNYLKNSPKPYLLILLLCLILTLILSLIIKYESVITVDAITVCENNSCTLNFYKNYNAKYNFEHIKIKGKEYVVKDIIYGEVKQDNNNTYFQEVALILLMYPYKNNEIVKVDLINSKKSLLKLVIDEVKE